MPIFAYEGLSKKNARVRGTIAADSPRHAREQLRGQGISVQDIAAVAQQRRSSFLGQIFNRHSQAKWNIVAHELSMMLSAGISLTESLDSLAKQHQGSFRASLLRLHDRVATGASFADALAEQPNVYDSISVRLVEVGESTGALDRLLAELAEFKMQSGDFRDRVVTALLYPAFLAVTGIVAMIFLMTWVMPPLLESLEETLPQLPLPTRIARSLSEFLVAYGWWLFGAAIGLTSGTVLWTRTNAGQRKLQRFVMSLPWVGPFVMKQAVARIALVMGLLLRSGVVLAPAMRLAAESSANYVFRDALLNAEAAISGGEDVAVAFEKTRVFPPLAVRFFSVGQDTGKLDTMLLRLASDYNRQVKSGAARMAAIIEPLMIVMMAFAIGFLLVATILPILEAGNLAQ